MLSSKLLSSIGNTDRLYVDDVFSAYTYTGNSSTQTINNGIDLAGEGGMVWCAARSSAFGHYLFDTSRGLPNRLSTHNTNAQASTMPAFISSFNTNGFSTQNDTASTGLQTNNMTGVTWTFRKAPKFFDVVTYTGDGTSNRALSHQLNADVGMVMVKATSATGDWWVFHRSATGDLVLNTTAAQTASKANIPSATTSTFTVSGSANTNGVTYVAYLWAHDPSADGIIQCGIGTSLNLGWEPQFVLFKNPTGTSNWEILDTARGWANADNAANGLRPNTSEAEQQWNFGSPTSTGTNALSGATQIIYLAIRRPNKPPTTGTQVYNAVARTGTSAAANVAGVGFAPDLVNVQKRIGTAQAFWQDRLRGAKQIIYPSMTTAESTDSVNVTAFLMDGFTLGAGSSSNNSGDTYINHFFKRAPGFFDVVCYTGTGSAQTVNHSLGVAPEMVIVKGRQFADAWTVWHSALPNTDFLLLSLDDPAVNGGSTYWNNTSPTSSVFSVGSNNRTGASARPYVAYLFASLPGVSKVGSYVGNGTSQTIDCGFASGARFVLIKTTAPTYTGGWAVGDSTRGIVAGNDPVLYLNTTAAEVTSLDWLDPHSSGFTVNETTGAYANTSGSTYVYLAIS